MSTPDKPPRRLLIGAGSFADAQAALRLADRLAETLAGDLGGLLVEETVLSGIVDLPGQRVVTSGGALLVAPSRRQVRTLFESDARAFRERLSGLARARMRKWSFERCHGDLIGGVCGAAKGWDILLLGHREIHRRRGRVVLIAPPGAGRSAAPDLAQDLAGMLHTDLVALSLGPEAGQEHFATEPEMLARIGRISAAAVVLDLSAGPLRTHDQLRQLLSAARCPLVVLGAAQGEASIAHSTQIPPAPEDA
ncbi:hypothetical protein [Aestuariicoccus sp. MJ-SS9]|uniref:hypothetical protein n=1 Tax=Aestuariicoccus sp. MJ-SS9 TaxID=3079855 RepID=UPI00290FB09C|nr:hypothetical protein [Aestuariicoccus sp. MJ-SS9]MDU8913898.1 hypothetical protein [Aestuariicoccus sp. MJ-SS9]